MLTISEGLVRETLRILLDCGRDGTECVVLWVSTVDRPRAVDSTLHPGHVSGPRGYEIDPTWMHRLWVDLSERHRTVFAQVHSHPADAFHSTTDDEYPAVHSADFVSIVVPRFARPPIKAAEIHASVLEQAGWRRSTFRQEVRVV